MAKDFKGAREDAEARITELAAPVVQAVAGKAGTPKAKAAERLARNEDGADPVLRKLRTLTRPELERVAAAVREQLNGKDN